MDHQYFRNWQEKDQFNTQMQGQGGISELEKEYSSRRKLGFNPEGQDYKVLVKVKPDSVDQNQLAYHNKHSNPHPYKKHKKHSTHFQPNNSHSFQKPRIEEDYYKKKHNYSHYQDSNKYASHRPNNYQTQHSNKKKEQDNWKAGQSRGDLDSAASSSMHLNLDEADADKLNSTGLTQYSATSWNPQFGMVTEQDLKNFIKSSGVKQQIDQLLSKQESFHKEEIVLESEINQQQLLSNLHNNYKKKEGFASITNKPTSSQEKQEGSDPITATSQGFQGDVLLDLRVNTPSGQMTVLLRENSNINQLAGKIQQFGQFQTDLKPYFEQFLQRKLRELSAFPKYPAYL